MHSVHNDFMPYDDFMHIQSKNEKHWIKDKNLNTSNQECILYNSIDPVHHNMQTKKIFPTQ